jgi:hypothetical protein
MREADDVKCNQKKPFEFCYCDNRENLHSIPSAVGCVATLYITVPIYCTIQPICAAAFMSIGFLLLQSNIVGRGTTLDYTTRSTVIDAGESMASKWAKQEQNQ